MIHRFAPVPRRFASLALALLIVGLPGSALARQKNPKPGPLTGTWECVAHGTSRGDLPFTLTLEQIGETVTGSVSSLIGSTEIANATFRKKSLSIHIESGQGESYDLTGTFKKGQLSGQWAHGNEKGAWDGAKQGSKANEGTKPAAASQ